MMTRFLMWTPSRWPVMRVRTVLLCALVLGSIEAFAQGIDYHFGPLPGVAEIDRTLHAMQGGFLILMAVSFGLFRAGAFHPARNRAYRTWLKTSPWHAGLPLPLGPVTLVWQDAALLAVLSALVIFRTPLPPESIVAAFGAAYIFRVTFVLIATDRYTTAFILGLALAGIVRFFQQWQVVAGIVIAVYPAVHLAIKQSLSDFPWESAPKPASGQGLGWTFHRLGPEDPGRGMNTVAAIQVSVLIGAWVYAIFERVGPMKDDVALIATVLAFGLVLALVRWLAYAGGHGAPLSLKARLATGRLLIPRYDKILIMPAVIAAWTIAFPFFIPGGPARHAYPIYAGAFVASAFMLAFIPGPTRRTWTLSGFCHVRTDISPGHGQLSSEDA
ncbi:MAG TPA: hypothetical protein VH370_16270 [Humisphaera sp.]|jgi:hypothetical protein|nr:hypothetical protein [Humisphaera sp.]